MFRRLIKLGISVNLLYLGGGYLNSLYGKNCEDKVVTMTNEKYQEFNRKLNLFLDKYSFYNPNKLSIPSRDEMIEKFQKEKLEVLIIGGGSSGAGVLLEGYQAGYKCGLIESNDFASGTSSRSTKLIHGGIRYLEEAFAWSASSRWEKIKLVIEALKERDFLLYSIPYMNNLVEIKIPCYNLFQMDYLFTGVLLYHLMYISQSWFNFQMHTIPGPKLATKPFKYVSFHEGQFFDSRQCLISILTSCLKGKNPQTTPAIISNYTELVDYLYDDKGRIIGVKAYDKIKQKEFSIYSDIVVNCTGIYADSYLSNEDKLKDKLITASKGTHIVVDKSLFKELRLNSGFMIPKTSDGRVLFILPYQRDYFLIGTTDAMMNKARMSNTEEVEINYIIKEIKTEFKISEETIKAAIKSKWSGLRPLVCDPNKVDQATKSLARNHVIRVDEQTGLISLLGGKWTIYRQMGADVIGKIKTILPKETNKSSDNVRLLGAYHMENVDNKIKFDEEKIFYAELEAYLQRKYQMSNEKLVKDLVFRYGLNAIKVLEINQSIPEKERYITENLLKSELIYSIRYEMTIKSNDFICRRTGLAFTDMEQAKKLIDTVSEIIGKELKQDKETIRKEKQLAKESLEFLQ